MSVWIRSAELFVDLVKGTAWPIAAAVIAVKFRPELQTLLTRIRRAGPAGVDFDPAEQQKSSVEQGISAPAGISHEPREIKGLSRTPAMANMESRLKEFYKNTDQAELYDRIVLDFARTTLELVFERVYRNIFGSQIRFLKFLNSNEPHRAINQYYEAKSNNPNEYENITFDQWASYLVSWQLVVGEGVGFRVTDFGRDFLVYLAALGLSENKPY